MEGFLYGTILGGAFTAVVLTRHYRGLLRRQRIACMGLVRRYRFIITHGMRGRDASHALLH